MVPKSLQESLPFASKPKDTPSRRRRPLAERRAVIWDSHERKVHALVQQLQLIRNEKVCWLYFIVSLTDLCHLKISPTYYRLVVVLKVVGDR